jgi:integrase
MPIKLIPPRKGFSPYYYGRGTYLGIFVNRSTKTDRPQIAKRVIKQWEIEIERGRFATCTGPTFLSAAVSYMQAGGERTYIARLIAHFGKEKPLSEIDQAAVDGAAAALYPQASNATRNRSVYTPISAILQHAGKGFDMRRPKGAQGRQLTGWLTEEQASALLAAAIELDREFGVLCTVLLYTGCRLSEPLKVRCTDVNLAGSEMFVPTTKNGDPRRVFLPATAMTALVNHPRGLRRGTDRIFRFTKSGALSGMLRQAAKNAGVALPAREAFHIFCHTYATWFRRYANADLDTLVATGRWKSRQSAQRYMHMVVSEESQRAELLPALRLNYQ